MPIICWGNLAKSADDTQRIEQAIQAYVEEHDENVNAHMGENYSLGAHRLQAVLDHPYGSIRYWHVEDIHAEAITAGGMVVKGSGPYISVQEGEGVERVKIYPEGIIVKKGSIVVENEGEQEIIDARGIRGGNIFYSNVVLKETTFQIPGQNQWYPVSELNAGIYLARQTPVLFFGEAEVELGNSSQSCSLRIQYPGGYHPGNEGWWSGSFVKTNNLIGRMSFMHILSLYAGFNTVRLVALRESTSWVAQISGSPSVSTFGYIVLGN